MSLKRLDLSGSLCVQEECTKLTFSDTTGFLFSDCADEQNDSGYGLVGGIALNDVTEAILNIYYPSMTTPFKYTFTIDSAVINTATITDMNGVVTDIFSKLESTDFSLTNFDTRLAAYGVTFPELNDGIMEWDYTISGLSSGISFQYTTSGGELIDCNTDCCIEKKYLDLVKDCDCCEDKKKDIIKSEIFLWAARYAINVGQDSKADAFIIKAKEICDSNCQTC